MTIVHLKPVLVVVGLLLGEAVSMYRKTTDNGTDSVLHTQLVFFPMIWEGVIEAGERALRQERNNVTSNSTCEQHLAIYAEGLAQRATWAVTMYDSTGKQGPGLLDGWVTWHGNFYRCIKLKHQLPETDGTPESEYLYGRYCSAMFEVPVWLIKFMKEKDLPFNVPLPSMTVDLCVPSGCVEEDLETVIKAYLEEKSTGAVHTLYDVTCHKNIYIADDTAAVISLSILISIFVCVIIGSVIDVFLVLHTHDVQETSVQTIGVRDRAGSLLSRAGSIFSRQGSIFSRQGSTLSRQGSILSRQSSIFSGQGGNRSKIFRRRGHLPSCTRETIIPTVEVGSQENIIQSGDGDINMSTSPTSTTFQDDVLSYIISHDAPAATAAKSNENDITRVAGQRNDSVSPKILDEAEAKAIVMRLKEASASPPRRNYLKEEHAHGHQTSLEPINELHNLCSTPPSEPGPEQETPVTRSVGHTIFEIFLCFSFQRNLKRVLGEGSANYLFCLNGVRVLSITWIVMGNTVSFLYKAPDVVANIVVMVAACQSFVMQAIINATFAADTFFVLSGTLLAYNWMIEDQKEKLKRGKARMTIKSLLILYFHRFIRIAPCYYILILTFTNLLPYFGKGPRWKYVSDTIHQCKDHWWANALFISNFYKAGDMCMSWTYYLVNDFQFYLISPIILIPLAKYPPIGYILLLLLVAIQIVSTSVLNDDINGNILRMGGGYFANVYAKPYCRVGVFAIGIALGYALFKAGRRVYFRKTPLLFGWCVSLMTLSLVVFITYSENRVDGVHWTSSQSAMYEALSRPAWALAVSWIIFCCCIGQGGFIETFLSWNFFLPLCRITYGIYLIHPLIIVVIVDSSEHLIHIGSGSVVSLFIYVLVSSIASALVLITFVEGPFIKLEKVIRSLVPR
ncbi:uncharacterized protein LOC121367246 [Gigantopelta aegis]|uniref:uncharacterized protein LOC121367246 n=1 Tax=Gigantopelta aegis TaxID=1735272 RepID=UPI001B88A8E4|nr:uncharacterized protein LOC121367246 [Gigantopelta aegis]